MIKYNNSNINDWYFYTSDIIKVYRNNVVCYYKITTSGGTSGQTPCFAVVDDITQYQDTEFEDVFNKADGLWYKLNNLNQYEEYGIYGSGRTITYYEGKLTIDDGYEYQYSGGSWVNVGEVSGSSITIKSPEYIEKDSSHNGKINLDYVWKTNSKMQFKFYSTNNGGGSMIGEYGMPDNNDCRMFFASTTAYFDWGSSRISWSSNGQKNTLYEYEYGNYYIKNMVTSASKTGSTISTSRTNPLYLGVGSSDRFRTYYIKFYEGDTLVKDFIPWTDTNGNFGLYEKVSNTIYSATSGSFTASSVWNDVEVGGGVEYPVYYDEIQDPPDNLVFSSMAEAEAYECPWVGMKATIAGDNYVFSGDSQSGYEWVEDINHHLPDIPYSLNYNAKQYIASTYTIPQTEGQLQNVDAVCSYGYKIVDHSSDGYISVTGDSRMIITGNSGTYLNRSNTQANCPMTIISKAKTTNGYSVFTNRTSSARQYMYRQDTINAYLCGSGATTSISCSDTTPSILSVRVYYDNGIKAQWNNWSTSESITPEAYGYNSQNLTNGGALFCDYTNNNTEFWQGDFYWIYMSQNTLTDEQIQQVIDYNENL